MTLRLNFRKDRHGRRFSRAREVLFAGLCGLATMVCAGNKDGVDAGRQRDSAFRVDRFVSQIETQHPGWVVRRKAGDVYCLTVPGKQVDDESLELISGLPSLTELKLFVQADDLTTNGIATLLQLTNLRSLTIECPRVLKPGLLSAVCRLRTLGRLKLNWAVPPVEEYCSLTNLVRLEELALYGAPNLSDNELKALAGLPILKKLRVTQAALSENWPKIVGEFPSLVEAVVGNGEEKLAWTRFADP